MAREEKRLAAADVLRVTAIFIVAWYHFWQQSWLDPSFSVFGHYVNLQGVIRHGYMMVDATLALSGFLLALPYARRRLAGQPMPPAGEFYRRRFWRIVPSYLLAILTVMFGYAIPGGHYPTAGAMVKDLVTHLTFTQTFFYDTYVATSLPVVLWTLAVEAQFYVLWPLIVQYYIRRPAATCGAMILLACAIRAWVSTQSDTTILINQLPCMLDLYACGMLAAAIYARLDAEGRPSPACRRRLAPAGMLVCMGGMLWVLYIQPVGDYEAIRLGQLVWRLPMAILSGGFLVCGCLAPPGLARVLGNPVTRFLSLISYNYYIWHQFLACRLKDWHIPAYADPLPNQAGEQPWQTRYTLLCFGAALVLAAAVTYGFERPLRRWGMKKTAPNENAAS